MIACGSFLCCGFVDRAGSKAKRCRNGAGTSLKLPRGVLIVISKGPGARLFCLGLLHTRHVMFCSCTFLFITPSHLILSHGLHFLAPGHLKLSTEGWLTLPVLNLLSNVKWLQEIKPFETPDSEQWRASGSWYLGEHQACLGLSSWQQRLRRCHVHRASWTLYSFLTSVTSKQCFITTSYSGLKCFISV